MYYFSGPTSLPPNIVPLLTLEGGVAVLKKLRSGPPPHWSALGTRSVMERNAIHASMVKKRIEEATASARDEEAGVVRVHEIHQWPIEKVKPYKKNAKLHPSDQVESLARMIKRHGFDVPIVVDAKGVVIKGHGRLLAAKTLGMATVPVIVRADLSEALMTEARIGDNRVGEYGWDLSRLVSDVVSGMQAGLDVAFTCFTLEELGLGHVELAAAETREEHEEREQDEESIEDEDLDDAVEPPKEKTAKRRIKLGETWQIGGNTLTVGEESDAVDQMVATWERITGLKAKRDHRG